MKKNAHNVKIEVHMKRWESDIYTAYLVAYQSLTEIRLGSINRSLSINYQQTNGVNVHPTRLSANRCPTKNL
ncbi:hypothetical protein ABVC68_05010 [Hoylesella timonensis]